MDLFQHHIWIKLLVLLAHELQVQGFFSDLLEWSSLTVNLVLCQHATTASPTDLLPDTCMHLEQLLDLFQEVWMIKTVSHKTVLSDTIKSTSSSTTIASALVKQLSKGEFFWVVEKGVLQLVESGPLVGGWVSCQDLGVLGDAYRLSWFRCQNCVSLDGNRTSRTLISLKLPWEHEEAVIAHEMMAWMQLNELNRCKLLSFTIVTIFRIFNVIV